MLPRLIVVDTGPLADFLVSEFVRTGKVDTFHAIELRCLRQPEALRAFGRIFVQARLATVAGVFAETHRIARRTLRTATGKQKDALCPVMAGFWNFARCLLSDRLLDERWVRLLDLPVQDLKDAGPVDASLVAAAAVLRRSEESMAVVADDQRVKELCRSNDIRYLWVEDLPRLVYA